MPIKNKTETKDITPEDLDITLDPEDQERDAAAIRGFAEHDTLSFDGMDLRPVTAGTWMLLERSGNRLLVGDVSNAISDAAAFILIHSADNRHVRHAIFNGGFDELVYEFLDELDDAHAKLMKFAPTIARMVEDYTKTQTQDLSPQHKKKSGRRTG